VKADEQVKQNMQNLQNSGGIMIRNEVVDSLMSRRSIRKYTEQIPSEEEILTVVRGGQQAPFAMQLGSVIIQRNRKTNVFNAPIQFIILCDLHRMERVMKARGWRRKASNIHCLMFGVQDAAYMAQNMVTAAESLGMGSCYIGAAPYMAEKLKQDCNIPDHVFPLVILTMGFPAEDPPVRPRYPIEFHLFEEKYQELTDEMTENAMTAMDQGYLAQNYYRNAGFMIPVPDKTKKEDYTFDNYSWTEHISRKLALWGTDPEELGNSLKTCGLGLDKPDDPGWDKQ
ncbi:MAG: nitroreductase family protein, partial [Candidatus Fermentibacteria bacterium]|nr:nitroreductase family protein [Candidatus Fermentibacteria bacterium]